jgi:hypothetical protein
VPSISSLDSTPRTVSRGKQRNPWLVLVLTVVTLGLYELYWFPSVARELEGFDESLSLRTPAKIGPVLVAGPLAVVAAGSALSIPLRSPRAPGFPPASCWRAQRASVCCCSRPGDCSA